MRLAGKMDFWSMLPEWPLVQESAPHPGFRRNQRICAKKKDRAHVLPPFTFHFQRANIKCPVSILSYMAIEQIRVGSNFSYVVYCRAELVGALVDPGTDATKALGFIDSKGIDLRHVILTHHHADHTASVEDVLAVHMCHVIASALDALKIKGVSKTVADGETLNIGGVALEFLTTPGHTPGSICIKVDESALMTGDTLFIGDCGRTDLPGGSNRQMYETLQRLKNLPDNLLVYPGHDYGDRPFDRLGNQKLTNKAMLAASVEELAALP